MSGLLATKLRPPPVSPKRVERPRLIQRLNEGLESGRQITLVSAPAGFGKTTCISEWVTGLNLPVAWLSLDAADDDPGRFFAYLIAALQKVKSDLGGQIEGVLRSGQLPPSEVISATLINDLLEVETPFLLVLDDLQGIQDPSILQFLERLVTNLPEALSLVLLTREDPSLPLARLRGNNQLTEIRAADLRFTDPEASRFLNQSMGLSLPPADVATLEDRTEGWIVGLQLAALALQARVAPQSASAMREQADPSQFIATLSGSHRYILSYLTEEVLSRQPEEIQLFLLQTSILEKLSGDLCDAVTGRKDSRFLLERLFNANLFLTPLDDEQQWYRYHPLFADLLRDRQKVLQKGQTLELHQRASRWYAQAGMPGEAIQHALAAADFALAVNLIELHALEMLFQGYAKTVDGWMQAIPPEWGLRSPRANLAFAWMYLISGNYLKAIPYVERLQAMFSISQMGEKGEAGLPPMPAALEAEWLALQSTLLNAQGKPAESLVLASRALEIVPEDDSFRRSLVYMGLAGAYQEMNDYPRTVEALQEIIIHGRAAGNFISEMLGISGLVQRALQHGQYRFAFEIASQGIERVERSGALPPISAAVYGALALVYYQRNQVELARKYYLRTIQLSNLGGYSDAQVGYSMILSRWLQLQGDLDAASAEIQKAASLMQVSAPAWAREEVVSQQVRLDLAQDRLAEAEATLVKEGFSAQGKFSVPDLAPGQGFAYSAGLLYNSALRILLYRARAGRDPENARAGIELADRLVAVALRGQYLLIALEALLLRAQLYGTLGEHQASLADIARALELAEPEGFISLFIEEGPEIKSLISDDRLKRFKASIELNETSSDRMLPYIDRILLSFPSSGSPPFDDRRSASPNMIEPLTGRELDVLRLMAEGLKYEEIAGKLFVSVNTVRTHVKAIYGKLSANNRTKAIQVARQLQLL